MTKDFVLPKWDLPAHGKAQISSEAYLAWLSEERAILIRNGQLEKLKADPARQPVDARFVLDD